MGFIMHPKSLQFDCITPCRKCAMCEDIKSLCEFKLKKDYIYSYCDLCDTKYNRKYSKTEKRTEYMRSYKSGDDWKTQANKYQTTHRKKLRSLMDKTIVF